MQGGSGAADEGSSLNGGESMRAGLPAALAPWGSDPVLAPSLAESSRLCLVLDAAATTVLYASTAAGPLRDAVADEAGGLNPGFASQIRALGPLSRPRLVRLRLDPRRIAAPTACLVAGGEVDGASALLVVAVGPLPAFRARPDRREATQSAAPDATPISAADVAAPAVGDRFVWRSDAADRLTALSGPSVAALAPLVVGRSWAELAQADRLRDADALLAALRTRRTFRALSATLDAGMFGLIELHLSGTCLGRRDDAFSGFGGYGTVRAAALPTGDAPRAEPAFPPAPEIGPHPETPASAPDDPASGSHGSGDPRALPDTRLASWPPVAFALPVPGNPAEGDNADIRAGTGGTAGVATGFPVEEPVGQPAEHPVPAFAEAGAAPQAEETVLSVTEHAAFREIARALGARYAGDEPGIPDGARAESGGSAAVMPFPAAKPIAAEAPSPLGAVETTPLADVPAALLIHRGDAVLAANRRLLDLTGYTSLASLQAAGL